MSIVFYCRCGKKVRAPDNLSGQRGRCPQCHATFMIPTRLDPQDAAAQDLAALDESDFTVKAPSDADLGTTANFTGDITEFKGDPGKPQRYIIDPETFVVTAEDFD